MLDVLTVAALIAARVVPPAKYDHPIPMDQIQVHRHALKDIPQVCNMGRKPVIACAYVHDNVCHMVLPPWVEPGSLIWRHEQAHCNGWPSNHKR